MFVLAIMESVNWLFAFGFKRSIMRQKRISGRFSCVLRLMQIFGPAQPAADSFGGPSQEVECAPFIDAFLAPSPPKIFIYCVV